MSVGAGCLCVYEKVKKKCGRTKYEGEDDEEEMKEVQFMQHFSKMNRNR